MTTTKRGGHRAGSGSKPHPPEQVASVRIVANVTPAEAQEWARRGRTAWLRPELRKLAGRQQLTGAQCATTTNGIKMQGRLTTRVFISQAGHMTVTISYQDSADQLHYKTIAEMESFSFGPRLSGYVECSNGNNTRPWVNIHPTTWEELCAIGKMWNSRYDLDEWLLDVHDLDELSDIEKERICKALGRKKPVADTQ